MYKLFVTLLILLSGFNLAFAQEAKPQPDFKFEGFAQLQALPKHTRDSLVTAFRKMGNVVPSTVINNKDISGGMASTTKKFYASIMELMIQVLENPDEALTAKNQAKFDRLQQKMERDMSAFADKMSYEEDRKSIISKYKNGQFDDAKEKRDARKEMDEKLKKLKRNYQETLKEARDEAKEDEREAKSEA